VGFETINPDLHKITRFFEFLSQFVSDLLQFVQNARMALRDLAEVTSEGFGDYAEVSLDFFNLGISHGTSV
jgi:hypothetical protein